LLQAVIDANIILPLVQILLHAEFDIKKEAALAIFNVTDGGSYHHIKYGSPLHFICLYHNFSPFYYLKLKV